MRLKTQIFLTALLFGIMVFFGVAWQSSATIKDFIAKQFEANSAHTANSLALSMQADVDANDIVTMKTKIRAMFDNGLYELIELTDVDGNEIAKDYREPELMGVEKFLSKFIELDAPVVQADIMSNWIQFGKLSVKMDTVLAYEQLKNTLISVLVVLCCIFVLAFIALSYLLKLILDPLDKVRMQAEYILQNSFHIEDKIPFTIELKKMVLAMNRMVGKVKDIFDKEAETLRQNYELLYKDNSTKLYNRRLFQDKIREYLNSDTYSNGVIVFISFKDLINYKKILGYEMLQSFLLELGKKLSIKCEESGSQNFLARLGDDDFVVLAPFMDTDASKVFISEITEEIKALFEAFNISEEDGIVHFAVAKYTPEISIKKLFSEADIALIKAKQNSSFSFEIYVDKNDSLVLGKNEYKELIQNAMMQDKFKFVAQKASSIAIDTLHYELFLRLEDDNGNLQLASFFMPMVNELGFSAKLDFHVVLRVVSMANKKLLPDAPLTINLGKEVLSTVKNLDKLKLSLKKLKSVWPHMVYIEVPDTLNVEIERLKQLSVIVKNIGFGFGMDNFNLSSESILRLKELNPDYIKIQGRYLIDQFYESGSQQSKQALDVIVKSKEVKIIALGVESEDEKTKLLTIGIEAFQGNGIHKIIQIG